MFFINILEYMFQLDMIVYIFGAFAFFGTNLLVRRLVLKKGV